MDGFIDDGATVLANYRHPHFGRWPAITTRVAGQGRITYIGTVPDLKLAEAVMRWAGAGRTAAWNDLPASVTCTSATAADGSRLRFVHNWSGDAAAVIVPVDCRDVLTGKPLPAGQRLELGARDARVLVEIPREPG